MKKIIVKTKAELIQIIKSSPVDADLNHLDVSNLKDMSAIFDASDFNGDISQWDTSNVTNMREMFSDSAFNGDISKWNVSNVTNMEYMFWNSDFNGDISQWDTSNVTNMSVMFCNSAFNEDISKWDISNVTNMGGMFRNSAFNGDISQWNIHPDNYFGKAYVEASKLRHGVGVSCVTIPVNAQHFSIVTELKELSEASKEVPLESKMLKLMEEVGEASQALLKQNGLYNASDSNSNFLEEMVDISLIVSDILHRIDPTGVNVSRIQSEKLKKWRSRFK